MTHEPWTPERTARVARLVRSLYSVVRELQAEFVDDDRRFTLDGHLVGSIGEVVAAYSFGLALYPTGESRHDAEAADGRKVQIKLTGGTRAVALSGEPDYLIALQLREFRFHLVYNGPGGPAWAACTGPPDARQRPVTLARLRALDAAVADVDRIVMLRPLPDLSKADLGT